jgi:hypothetical protein
LDKDLLTATKCYSFRNNGRGLQHCDLVNVLGNLRIDPHKDFEHVFEDSQEVADQVLIVGIGSTLF